MKKLIVILISVLLFAVVGFSLGWNESTPIEDEMAEMGGWGKGTTGTLHPKIGG